MYGLSRKPTLPLKTRGDGICLACSSKAVNASENNALITKGWFPPSFWQPSESPSDANLAFEQHPVSSLPYAIVVEDYTTEPSQELAASRGEIVLFLFAEDRGSTCTE